MRNCRIKQHLKSRPRTLAIDRVRCACVAFVVSCAGQRRQFASRGKPHDSDARWIDTPLRCAAAYQANSAVDVVQFRALDGVSRAFFPCETIFENKSRDAMIA